MAEKNFFIINITYQVPLEKIDNQIQAHRDFLDENYNKNIFLTSGPKNPRTGGIILARCENLETLENVLAQDPFSRHRLAQYEIIPFSPTKSHPQLADLLKPKK